MPAREKKRCKWAGIEPIYVAYHDEEWGVPVHDDRVQFEFLILEGAQAGLSWITILKRREGYRKAFSNFDAQKVARYDKRKMARLLEDPDIIRNRLKIESAVGNARAFLDVVEEFGSFDDYIWRFVDWEPTQSKWKTMKDIPAETEDSRALSHDLKQREFRFVGPTIIYAHMQATGMVNDHVMSCFRHNQVARLGKKRRSHRR